MNLRALTFIPSFALRNLLRGRRRSLFSVAVLATGVAATLLFTAFIERIFWGVQESTIHSQTGHLQITRTGYDAHRSTDPFGYLLHDHARIKALAAGLPHVQLVTTRIEFSGIVGIGDRSAIFVGMGVEPDKEPLLSSFDTIVGGSDLFLGDPAGGLLGKGLARALAASIGESMLVMTRTGQGGLNAVDMVLRGVTQSDSADYDERVLKMPMGLASSLLNTDAVTRVVVLLDDTAHTAAAKAALGEILRADGLDVEIRDWQEMNPTYRKVVGLYYRIFSFVAGMTAIIVVLSTANAMTMSYMERIRELGLMRAMGTPQRMIGQIFLGEGLLLGLAGGLTGGVLAAAISIGLNTLIGGIEMPPPPGSDKGFVMLIHVAPLQALGALAAACLVAALSCVPAILKSGRMQVVQAIRHQ